MINHVANLINQRFITAIEQGGSEPLIVERFISSIGDIQDIPNVIIRSAFVHAKPMVFFENPSKICNKSKCEVGDIALVVKRFFNSMIVEHRFTLGQVKKTKHQRSTIEPHQLIFYTHQKDISFRFGDIYAPDESLTPQIFRTMTRSQWFGYYIFINDIQPIIVCKPHYVENQYAQDCRKYNFILPEILNDNHFAHDYCHFEEYLCCFLQRESIGSSVTRKTAPFLDVLYKAVGLIPDPPEEISKYLDTHDGNRFGIIEITIKGKS